MSATSYEHLAKEGLESLGHTTAAGLLDQIAQQAAADGWSYSHFFHLKIQYGTTAANTISTSAYG